MAGLVSRVFLFAGHDRAALITALHRAHATPLDALLAAHRGAPAPTGAERLAIITEPRELHARLAFAIERLPALTNARFVSRPHGLYCTSGAAPGRVAFLFPGQGSEHVGMLRVLRTRVAGVRRWFDLLDAAAEEYGGAPLTPLIDVDAAGRDPREVSSRGGLFDMARGGQLGTAADLAMHDVVRALGLRADVYLGHSNGEHAAVMAAGVAHLDDQNALCRWCARVAQAGARQPAPREPERLIAVSLPRADRLPAVLASAQRAGACYLAMDNCPTQIVFGGRQTAVDTASREILSAGGLVLPLPFARAYHTPLFADWAAVFDAHYAELTLGVGHAPVVSCSTTEPFPDDAAGIRRVMVGQWTEPVRFTDTIRTLHASGVRTFIEVGPESRLTTFVADILRGRPHVAVSTSSTTRGELEQLAHLFGELFVAGLDVDPERLARLAGEDVPPLVPGVPSMPGRDVRQIAAGIHAGLIAEAQAQLERIASAMRARAAAGPVGGADASPLLQTIDVLTPTTLAATRTFSRQQDPVVDDHALGRRDAGWPGDPLPVLPFTLSLELLAEGARRLTGERPCEMLDVRGSRWLALDGGTLSVTVSAQREGDRARVRLIDTRTPADVAFEATVTSAPTSADAIDITMDPDAIAPSRWDAPAFYERYAFHGPGFRGISRVTAVGPSSIEAELHATDNPGWPLSQMTVDPAMLDCAGQLVAFWLLEQEARSPTFGIFPFSARRVTIAREPVPAGTRVRCRGNIRFDRLTTMASFVFETEDGARIAAIDGLAQRLIAFPTWLAHRLFGRSGPQGSAPRSGFGSAPADDLELLTGSWGIWGRALAHLCVSAADLDRWRAISDPDARASWLLARVPATTNDRTDAGNGVHG